MTETTVSHAEQNGRGHIEEILAAYLAVEWLETADWKRNGNDLNTDARRLLRESGWEGDNTEDTLEAIRTRLEDGILSLEVRSGWNEPGLALEPEEFRITLSTGGPALRAVGIIGEQRTALQHQDWGTPWTGLHLTSQEDDALEWWADLLTGHLEAC